MCSYSLTNCVRTPRARKSRLLSLQSKIKEHRLEVGYIIITFKCQWVQVPMGSSAAEGVGLHGPGTHNFCFLKSTLLPMYPPPPSRIAGPLLKLHFLFIQFLCNSNSNRQGGAKLSSHATGKQNGVRSSWIRSTSFRQTISGD